MRNMSDQPASYRTRAATDAVEPTKDDFNFYMRGKTPEQIENEITELMVGFGYSLVGLSIMLVIGTFIKSAVG